MAAEPLPSSNMFAEALRNSDTVDESGLSQWDVEPPYDCSNGKDGQYMENLVDIMHGRHLRQAQEREDGWIDWVKAGDVDGVRDGMLILLENTLMSWKRLISGYVTRHRGCDSKVEYGHDCDSTECQMERHYLTCQARNVCSLHADICALKSGPLTFIDTIMMRRK
jgi:hypothetical protein